MERSIIGIPIGDPSGIGPEIVLKALENKGIYDICRPLVIGSVEVIKKISVIIASALKINVVSEPEQGKYVHGCIDIISLDNINADLLRYGIVQPESGKAAYEYIKKTVELALEGQINAIATTPINKEAIRAANINFIGHTEILADLTQTEDLLTMFQVNNMRIFFLSRHIALKEVCNLIKKYNILKYIEKCSKALEKLGLNKRLIAVAGLNPHNGEHGLFGDEEVKEIEPAINEAKERGIDVVGPVSPDSVFFQALKGKYDAVLSLYHDQGHIAAKTVDFEKTISLTIGMPFIRTSVDHGTAFDIAGKGIASSISLEEAIKLAAEYSHIYRNI